VYDFAKDSSATNLDQLRARLHKMPDEELLSYGKASAYMCTPLAQFGFLHRPIMTDCHSSLDKIKTPSTGAADFEFHADSFLRFSQ
jgi:hypothetical protein